MLFVLQALFISSVASLPAPGMQLPGLPAALPGTVGTTAAGTQCGVLDWVSIKPEIALGNNLVQFAQGSGLIQALASAFNPLNLQGLKFDPMTFPLLGMNWTLQMVVNQAVIGGLNTITVYPLDAPAPTKLLLGGSLGTLEVQQLDVSVYVNQVKLDFVNQLRVYNGSLQSMVDLQVMTCLGLQALTCALQSGVNILGSFSNGNVGPEVLKHVRSASVDAAQIKFGYIETLNFGLAGASAQLPNEIIQKVTDIVKTTVNSNAFIHSAIESVISAMAPSIANAQIAKFQPYFLSSC
jgi:hypothetical protein